MEALDITARVARDYQIDPALFTAYMEYEGINDLEEGADRFGDQFAGIWTSVEAWAEEMLEGSGELESLPVCLHCYFDYAAYARDCRLNSDIWTIETNEGTAVFWSR